MRRRTALILALAVSLMAFAGCSMTDYRMDFDVNVSSFDASSAVVTYTLTNTGYETLRNATATIEVEVRTGPGARFYGRTSTPLTTIGVNSSTSGSVVVNYANGTYVNAAAYVISAGWDKSGSSGPF